MGLARKLGSAILGWCAGVVVSVVAAMLLATGANAWQVHQEGVGIGLFALAIWLWGFVIGVLIVGPVGAVLLVRRASTAPAPDSPQASVSGESGSAGQIRSDLPRPTPLVAVRGEGARTRGRRSAGAVLAWVLASTTVVAVGALVGCIALGLTPCRGLSPHERIARGDFGYVLRSPDGSRDAFIQAFVDVGSIGLLTRDGASGSTGERTGEELGGAGVIPKDIAWMPDSRRLVVVLQDGSSEVGDRIGIFSFETGSMQRTFGLPFVADRLGGVDVSPDGASALVTSDRFAAQDDSFPPTGDLYRVDLDTGNAEVVQGAFVGSPGHPVYLDAEHAVVVDSSFDRSTLSLVDLDAGTVEELTPPDLNVVDVAGRGAGGVIVFFAFHSSGIGIGNDADLQDPMIASLDVQTGEVRELFAPGVLSRLRMQPGGVRAIALAETCSGECGGGAEVWVLDLSRYLG